TRAASVTSWICLSFSSAPSRPILISLSSVSTGGVGFVLSFLSPALASLAFVSPAFAAGGSAQAERSREGVPNSNAPASIPVAKRRPDAARKPRPKKHGCDVRNAFIFLGQGVQRL